jgi:cytochrome c oxidase cbb3-type subunit 3
LSAEVRGCEECVKNFFSFREKHRRIDPVALIFLLVVFLVLASPIRAQQPKYQQDAIEGGAPLYQANCAVCHADGAGVPGIDLKAGVFRHSTTDEDLFAVIKNGVPGTAMPAHPNFSSNDILSLVAYVRTMRDYGTKAVKLGDPQKGKALFEGAGGCIKCHRVNGKGSLTALDLSDTGALHPPAYLQRSLLDPDATAADEPQNRFMRAVKNDGTVIVGRRLNEDTFTVQLIDEQGNLVSLEKGNLRSLTVEQGASMPSLTGKFSDEEISDLVAYLVSLNLPRSPTGAAARGNGPAPGGHQ